MPLSSRTRTLAAVIACMAVYGVTVGFTTPVLSLLLETRGVGRTLIGLNAVMPSIALMLIAPFVPGLVLRFGMRRFLAGCLAGDLALVLLLPVFDSLAAWFVLRLAMGATLGGLFVAAETWINAVAEDGTRGRTIAVYNTVFYAVGALGPALVAVSGIEGWTPFLLAAALILLAAAPLAWAVNEGSLAQRDAPSFGLAGFVRAAPLVSTAVALFAVVEFTLVSLLPVYGVRSGLAPGAAALLLTAIGLGRVALQLPIGWLADRTRAAPVLIGCIASTCLGALALPWAVGAGMAGNALLFVWGGIAGGIYTVAMTMVGARYRGTDLATANAAFGVLWGMGGIAGPAAGGVAMDLWDPHGLPAMLVIACGAATLLATRVHGARS